MNYVLLVKQPRKKQQVTIVKKSNLQNAKDLVSTMRVMRPKWKCELLEAGNYSNGDCGIPEDVARQAAIQPLNQREEEFRETLLAMMR